MRVLQEWLHQWIDVGLSKDIKFICNTFIWDLIVEFYRAIEKIYSLVAIHLVGSWQPCFRQSQSYRI